MRTTAVVLGALLLSSSALANPVCAWSLAAPRAYEQMPYDRVYAIDFDGDGRLDTGHGTPDEFTIRYGLGGGKLSAPQTLALDVIAVADVIGSPLPDLITRGVGGIAPSVDIHPNLGNRTFGEPANVTASQVVTADFTGDGAGDLLAIEGPYSTLYVRSGNTLVRSGTAMPINLYGLDHDTGDVDGDGDTDLAVLDPDGRVVRLFLNDGRGVLTEREQPLAPQWPAMALEMADLAGDGRADVLTLSQDPHDFRARLDTFRNALPQPEATAVHNPDGFPTGLLVRDLTGDGAPDVIVSMLYPGHFDQRVVVYVNERGTLRRVQSALAVPRGFPLETGDFTGDGIAELIAPTENGFALITGSGDGTFFLPRALGDLRGNQVNVTDLNGDGADDLVFQHDDADVVAAMNDGRGNFTTSVVSEYPFHYGLAYVGASDGDVIAIDLNPNTSRPVFVYRRTAAGAWVLARRYDSLAVSAQTHDLNGDGTRELILLDERMVASGPDDTRASIKIVKVVAGNSDAVLLEHTLGPHLGASIVVAEVTGDAIPDLVVSTLGTQQNGWYPPETTGAVQIFRGRGDATFDAPVTLVQNVSAMRPAVGDFNGDGRNDIAFGSYEEALRVFYATESGFGPRVLLPGWGTGAIAADLNEDGISDLVSTIRDEATIWIGSTVGLVKREMYWIADYDPRLARLRSGGPLSIITNPFIVRAIDATCGGSSRRRSAGR